MILFVASIYMIAICGVVTDLGVCSTSDLLMGSNFSTEKGCCSNPNSSKGKRCCKRICEFVKLEDSHIVSKVISDYGGKPSLFRAFFDCYSIVKHHLRQDLPANSLKRTFPHTIYLINCVFRI